MPRWIDGPASAPEEFPRARTRTLLLPGTSGRDGQPLRVTVRELPQMSLPEFANLRGETQVGRLAQVYRRMAELAVVEPRFAFGEYVMEAAETAPPRWDDLPLVAQTAVVEAITELTTVGSEEVSRLEAAFRGAEPSGNGAGTTGGGRPEAVPDEGAASPVA